MGQAVYLVEFKSISHGIGALDAMCKRAGLVVFYANPVCIGKYLIAVGGDVADVAEAKAAAEIPEEEPPLSSCLLTGTHPAILAYFRHEHPTGQASSAALGIFETRTVAMGFLALDAALKASNAELIRIWLGTQLGGKLCWVLAGDVSGVESGIRAAREAVPPREHAGSRVIIAPDAQVRRLFSKGGLDLEPHGTNL